MLKKVLAPALIGTLLFNVACSSNKDKKEKKRSAETASLSSSVNEEGLKHMTKDWPKASKEAISDLREKYGMPSAVTEQMAVWDKAGPFEKSIVFREEVNHFFPTQHSDILQQTVNYRVPLDKIQNLAKFDGSLIVDRTKGQLSARNQKEEMNILSLNLADKIVRGEMTVEQARREYQKNAEAFDAGSRGDLLSSLKFDTQSNTSDPDTMMQSQEDSKEEKANDVIIIDEEY